MKKPDRARLPVARPGATPAGVMAVLTQAVADYRQQRWPKAEQGCMKVLKLSPDHFDALNLLGIIAINTQRFDDATKWFDRALAVNANDPQVQCNSGAALHELGRYDEALIRYDRALALQPAYPQALCNRALTRQSLGHNELALSDLDSAINVEPFFALAWHHRGRVLHQLSQFESALRSFDTAIMQGHDTIEAHFLRAASLQSMREPASAAQGYAKVIERDPMHLAALNNRGVVLQEIRQFEAAIASYDRSLAIDPEQAQTHCNRGAALAELGRFAAAIADFDRTIALSPGHAEAHNNRASALRECHRLDEALADYLRARDFGFSPDWLDGAIAGLRGQLCDWQSRQEEVQGLIDKLAQGLPAITPFALLPFVDSLPLQRRAAELWVAQECLPRDRLDAIARAPRSGKIKIGYFSGDFFEHATTQLAVRLFESHDRSQFEIIGFSFGPLIHDAMHQRVRASFDRFFEVQSLGDAQVALLAREQHLDVAVDMKGYTRDSRPTIFAHRAATVQVSYLGYPGTSGAPFIDYLIADPTLVPQGSLDGYSEKIVYLPDSYQVNDALRPISDRAWSKQESGLPADAFVFCCFNNNYKISPESFDSWMRILREVPGSVLWLLEDHPIAASNLRKEAMARGVDPDRLIFAGRVPAADHLARHRLADLCLDTFVYNAHTTASDALWAGVPILTCIGNSFAARVAASLLTALELPELIASSAQQFENMAIELATRGDRLDRLKEALRRQRESAPLFNTERFTRHLEDAYVQMVDRDCSGLAPDHIRVKRRSGFDGNPPEIPKG